MGGVSEPWSEPITNITLTAFPFVAAFLWPAGMHLVQPCLLERDHPLRIMRPRTRPLRIRPPPRRMPCCDSTRECAADDCS